jgi:hypothetical protein
MIATIHNWLTEHPIWQSVIINAIVGITLIIIVANWKYIVAFSRIPPQRLSIWLQKAKLNAAENKLYMFRRADRDSRYAVNMYTKFLVKIIVALAVMLFNVFVVSFRLLFPSISHSTAPGSLPLRFILHFIRSHYA